MKKYTIAFAALCPLMGFGDAAIILNSTPTVVRNAELREAIRQDSTWTSENIAKNPYLFLQDQIASCGKLMEKLDAQRITLVRMGKKAMRMSNDAESLIAIYSKFLSDAKVAFKAASSENKWPVSLNGYKLDEEELTEKIADALERVDRAKQEKKENSAIAKKVEIRLGILKTKRYELSKLRTKLVHQAEQVKMNAAFAKMGDLNSILGAMKDMMLEIDEDPTKLSIEDLTAVSPTDKRTKAVQSFLND